MTHTGSCHCGRVAFEAEGTIGGALDCNCSICRRRGSLLWFVPREQFRLTTPAEDVSTYTFHSHQIRHQFCARCGIHVYGEGTDPASGRKMAAISLRCVDGIDLAAIPRQGFDGAAL